MKTILEYLLSKKKTRVNNDCLVDTVLNSKAGSLMDDIIRELNRYSKESEEAKKIIDYVGDLQSKGFEVVWKCGYDTRGNGYLTLDKKSKEYDETSKLIRLHTYNPGYHSKELNLSLDIFDFEHCVEYEVIMSTLDNTFTLYELRDKDFEDFRRSVEDGSLEFELIISTALNSTGADEACKYLSKELK